MLAVEGCPGRTVARSVEAVTHRELAPVVFDIGNVLIHWDPHPAIAAAVGPERATAYLTDAEVDFASWNHAMDAGVMTWAEAEETAIARLPHWREEILAYRANFRQAFSGGLESTQTMLRELKELGLPLYGLTNWSAELFPIAYELVPILHELDDVIVSGVEQVAKPDPRIWQILATRTGRSCDDLVFTDDTRANIASAVQAGIDAIPFADPQQLRSDLVTRGYPLEPT